MLFLYALIILRATSRWALSMVLRFFAVFRPCSAHTVEVYISLLRTTLASRLLFCRLGPLMFGISLAMALAESIADFVILSK